MRRHDIHTENINQNQPVLKCALDRFAEAVSEIIVYGYTNIWARYFDSAFTLKVIDSN